MTSPHCDEDLGGFTLRQLLALQPTAGPEAPVWLVDGSAILVKSTDDEGPAIRRVDLASGAVAAFISWPMPVACRISPWSGRPPEGILPEMKPPWSPRSTSRGSIPCK